MDMIHDKIDEKHNFINKLINQTLNLLQFMTNLVLCMCGLFSSIHHLFVYLRMRMSISKQQS